MGFIAHSILAIVPPLTGDEATHWEWSRHLDWGYYDHPPMTAWSIALITSIFGQSQYALRLTSIFLHLATVLVLYHFSLETLRNKHQACNAAGLYMALPISVILGTAIGTDCSLVFFFTSTVYLVKKAIIDEDERFWIFAGITCGGMLLSKFMAVLFFPGLFLFLLTSSRHRKKLMGKGPYLATLISLIVFSPFLYWNMKNDWLTFQFNFMIRHKARTFTWEDPVYYVGGQMLALSPVVLVILVVALIGFIVQRKHVKDEIETEQKYRDTLQMLAFMITFPLIYYAGISFTGSERVGAHWAGIVFPIATLLLIAWFYSDKNRSLQEKIQRKKSLMLAVSSITLVSGGIIALLLFPKLLLPDEMLYTKKVYGDAPKGSHYFGWEKVGLRIDELRTELEATSEDLFFTSTDYALAAMLGFYTPSHPQFFLMNVDDKVVFGKTILLWSKGKKNLGADTLYVSDSPVRHKKHVQPFFKKMRQLEPLVIRDQDKRILRTFYFTFGEHYLGGEPDVLSSW